ncbi:hypothetical protein P152DRAFT_516874 [Eremomyces bilateralis CBS 781.70]|uniref:Uncharacterized protein n=1 Tax=Eremomyces bilateralis CBS 781.70 TaxID=1392243 RepID=A0A6G1FU49_9PEZI|nr:uncharacterized protein P152DRAFT_516874 [Eremomyces bilateralis CBS 781.70]KAF1809270.1 hypothetical protein P152DRAFT_516874 [Eremomyces bilateralis CBS 781.70]
MTQLGKVSLEDLPVEFQPVAHDTMTKAPKNRHPRQSGLVFSHSLPLLRRRSVPNIRIFSQGSKPHQSTTDPSDHKVISLDFLEYEQRLGGAHVHEDGLRISRYYKGANRPTAASIPAYWGWLRATQYQAVAGNWVILWSKNMAKRSVIVWNGCLGALCSIFGYN